MRRSVSQRIARLEEQSGITENPPPTIFILFPESEWKPGNTISPNFRWGRDWKQHDDEEAADYAARLANQLMAEGEKPPFKFLIFADPPGFKQRRHDAQID